MFHIQQCTIDHLADCSEIFREVYSATLFHDQWSVERSFEYLSRIYYFDQDSCYIAKADHTVIGAIFGYTFPWSSGTDFFIQELLVRATYRGNGIRESLITHVLEQNKEDIDIILVTRKDSENARFYEQHGITQNAKYTFFSGKFTQGMRKKDHSKNREKLVIFIDR